VEQRILEAGRVAGSGMNRQQRRFVVLRDSQQAASGFVTRPTNVSGAALVVAIVMTAEGKFSLFDAARSAQNMMLAAWSEGVASSPNALADPEGMSRILGIGEDESVATLISFGYPARDLDPPSRSPEEWLARADRLPLSELVEER
jgi:nitroreductase